MITINGIIRLVFVIETYHVFREIGMEFLNVGRIADVNFLQLIETVNCLSLVFSNSPKAQIEHRFTQNHSPVSTDFII